MPSPILRIIRSPGTEILAPKTSRRNSLRSKLFGQDGVYCFERIAFEAVVDENEGFGSGRTLSAFANELSGRGPTFRIWIADTVVRAEGFDRLFVAASRLEQEPSAREVCTIEISTTEIAFYKRTGNTRGIA